MEEAHHTEPPTQSEVSSCPMLSEAIDVEQRLSQLEAVALAGQCNQLGRNNREVSGRVVVICLILVFAIPAGLMISEGTGRLNDVRNGAADLLPMVLWSTSFAIPCLSILALVAIIFSMRVKFADADPPFGNTTRIHLDPHWYEVEWKAESGRIVSMMTAWSQTQIRWSENAWLIRAIHQQRQFLIKKESLSADQRNQFQQFALELSDWQRTHPNHTHHNNTLPAVEQYGIAYELSADQQAELDRLLPILETQGFVQQPFLTKHIWLVRLWLAIVCISALAFPLYSLLMLKQGLGLSWMFSIIPLWLLSRMSQIRNQTVAPGFSVKGLITGTGIWTQTPQARFHQSFSGLTDCCRLDDALILSWGKTNEALVVLKSSFQLESDWQAACRQLESVTTIRSI